MPLCTSLARALLLPVALLPAAVSAHFLELLPDTDILPEQGDHTVHLALTFTHPMERGPVMDLGEPVRFAVLAGDTTTDLRPRLARTTVAGKSAYTAEYAVKAPGDYVFYLEPAPYWEPAEKKTIIHYAKVVVDFASGEGWDRLVGLPVEIEPLTRPYGLWTHNLFRGVVRRDGRPLADAVVEVEWVNDGSIRPPADPYVTQVVKTDANGVFAYVLPRAGWWGFNAVVEAAQQIPGPDGRPAPAELGGTLWVKAVDMK